MPKVLASLCPDEETLSSYVSGSIDETKAESLSDHLHHCQRCQKLIDDFACRADSIVKALRRRTPSPSAADSANLEKLIARVATHDTKARRQKLSQADEDPIALDSFVTCLRKSGLVNESEIELLIEQIEPADSKSFARELISRRKITSFQAKALMRGKWKGFLLGNYIVLEKLGEGGMGHVFKARHRQLGRVVCIKVLHSAGRKSPQQVERFRREAKTMGALSHPNIVVAHDAGETAGIPFLVMEYIEGSDLSEHVAEHGQLDEDSAAKIVLQAARALQYAHEQGVVHRDIKPHNIILDTTETVKVLDLGLARFDSLLGGAIDIVTQASMTSSGAIMGTVDYMSPEQALNSKNADRRSDIYSLGCTLYYLLTGNVMFEGETIMEKLIAHREREIPDPRDKNSEIAPDMTAIYQRMVAKQPDGRYQTMDELADDLEALLAGEPPAAVSNVSRFADPRESYASEEALPTIQPIVSASPRAATNVRADKSESRWTGLLKHPAVWSVPVLLLAAAIGLTLYFGAADEPELAGADKAKAAKTPEAAPPLDKAPRFHKDTKAGGGAGRILVVLPHKDFRGKDFQAVKQNLDGRKVAAIVASTAPGKAQPSDAKHNKPVKVDVTLDKVNPFDFDGVVFVGGNVDEFKDEKYKPTMEQFVRLSQQASCPMVGLRDGYGLAAWSTKIQDCGCAEKKIGDLKVRYPRDFGAIPVVEVCDSGHLDKHLTLVLEDLAKDRSDRLSRLIAK